LEVSGTVRPKYGSLGVKRLTTSYVSKDHIAFYLQFQADQDIFAMFDPKVAGTAVCRVSGYIYLTTLRHIVEEQGCH